MMLTKDMQAAISRQMYNMARDIDVSLYNYLDNVMPNDYIIDGLMFYQTKDGGFAGGLYIDNYNVNTSVYQIYEAFRYMSMGDITVNCEHEEFEKMVNKALNVLYNRAEIKDNKWNPNVITNNDFAHSMEFEYTEENRKLFGYGPTAALLGYTLEYCKPTKAYYKKALKMIDIMLKDFYNMEILTKYEFIGFNSFLNSIKKLDLYKDDITKIEAKLIDLALKNVSVDFEDNSAIHPLDCALYLNDEKLNEYINMELDYIISSIAPHGLWDYTKSWGYDKYAEEDSAKLKWVGAISVNNFFLLKKFGRVE